MIKPFVRHHGIEPAMKALSHDLFVSPGHSLNTKAKDVLTLAFMAQRTDYPGGGNPEKDVFLRKKQRLMNKGGISMGISQFTGSFPRIPGD
jgi:hypothetical protein